MFCQCNLQRIFDKILWSCVYIVVWHNGSIFEKNCRSGEVPFGFLDLYQLNCSFMIDIARSLLQQRMHGEVILACFILSCNRLVASRLWKPFHGGENRLKIFLHPPLNLYYEYITHTLNLTEVFAKDSLDLISRVL